MQTRPVRGSNLPREHGASRKVALVGFEGFQILDIAGPLEVFTKAGRHLPQPGPSPFRYELFVASPSGGVITSNSGLQISGTRGIGELDEDLDTLFIAGGRRRPCATSRPIPIFSSGSPRAHREPAASPASAPAR